MQSLISSNKKVMPADGVEAKHLVVMQHGLWGNATNMAFLQQLLEQKLEKQDTPSVLLNSNVNELYKTYEGIDACGDRLTALIVNACNEAAAAGKPFTHLSLIGYSMGGLTVRYTVGKLHNLGLFSGTPAAAARAAAGAAAGGAAQSHQQSNGAPVPAAAAATNGHAQQFQTTAAPADDADADARLDPQTPSLQPLNFVTVATPHLGSWVLPSSLWSRAFNHFVPQVAARSGTQFMLLDRHALGRPLLVNMADPTLPFMQGLACFKHRMLLANTLHDRSVPYCTAAICEENPYATHEGVPISAQYPSIVQPAAAPRSSSCATKQSPPARQLTNGRVAVSPAAAAAAADDDDVDADMADADGDADGDMLGLEGTRSETAAGVQPRPRKGWGIRVAVLALLPLSLPLAVGMLTYMVHKGRKQWAAVLERTFDHSWVEQAAGSQRGPPDTAASPTMQERQPELVAAAAPAGPQHQQQQQQAQSSHSFITQLAGRAMQVPGPQLHSLSVRASHSGTPADPALASEDVDVNIDNGAKHLHVSQGLVDTPGSSERDMQLWMMRHLNALGWTKVDVDTRHYHAHAAIMLRQPQRFADNADCLHYLVDHMELAVQPY